MRRWTGENTWQVRSKSLASGVPQKKCCNTEKEASALSWVAEKNSQILFGRGKPQPLALTPKLEACASSHGRYDVTFPPPLKLFSLDPVIREIPFQAASSINWGTRISNDKLHRGVWIQMGLSRLIETSARKSGTASGTEKPICLHQFPLGGWCHVRWVDEPVAIFPYRHRSAACGTRALDMQSKIPTVLPESCPQPSTERQNKPGQA